MYTCPVCAYRGLQYPARDFTICPCCGNEFGYDDATRTFDELRREWIVNGMRWFSRSSPPPQDWNPVTQLLFGGFLPLVNKPGRGASESNNRYALDQLMIQSVGAY